VFFSVGNTIKTNGHFDVQTLLVKTNDNGNLLNVLSNFEQQLGLATSRAFLRYETGTSMSARRCPDACVDAGVFPGAIANQCQPGAVKALLINGARPVSQQ